MQLQRFNLEASTWDYLVYIGIDSSRIAYFLLRKVDLITH